jgi:hypothetical protein
MKLQHPWVNFASNLPTLFLHASDVGITDTNPFTGHDSLREKFLPTWGVPGTERRG